MAKDSAWLRRNLKAVFCQGLSLFCLFASLAGAQSPSKPAPTVTVKTYRAQLQRAVQQLKQLEAKPPRNAIPILKLLEKTQSVKRRDGQTQTASGDEWTRRLQDMKPQVSRSEAASLRQAVELRLRALDEWDKSTYTPADAQGIMKQLEGSGQIRTGQTRFQQFVADVSKWVRETATKFMRWIGSLFPSATPGKMPKIDPMWIKLVFTLTVLALLALLAYLVWRAIGGRIGKAKARRGVFAEGEDAELLVLPPDELRLRAADFARQGNFREALRHLYIALLLTLDARGVWRYDARRTNWEHIAALRADAARSTLVPLLSQITRIFDRVRYGDAPFGANDWQRFESEVNQLEAQTQTP